MTEIKIKTTETSFDVDDAMTDLAVATLVVVSRLNNLYSSVHPAIVWNESASVKEARRISSEVEFIKNKIIDVKKLIHEIDAYYDETE